MLRVLLKRDLGRPVQACDHAVFGPVLVCELPVEKQLCTGLDFTGGGGVHTTWSISYFVQIPIERLLISSSSRAVVTTPSPPGRGRCSQRRDPRVLTEPARWCVCCGQRNWQTPPSEGSGVFPPLSARGGALKGEASHNKGFLLLNVAVVHICSILFMCARLIAVKYLPPPLSGLESQSEALPMVELEQFLLPLLLLLIRTGTMLNTRADIFTPQNINVVKNVKTHHFRIMLTEHITVMSQTFPSIICFISRRITRLHPLEP